MPGESHGQRSLAGHRGHRERDVTEHARIVHSTVQPELRTTELEGASEFPGLSPFSYELAVVKGTQLTTQPGLPLPWASLPGLQCLGTESWDTPLTGLCLTTPIGLGAVSAWGCLNSPRIP